MSNDQQPKHLNRGLFADYYLDEKLGDQPEWDTTLLTAAERCFAQIKALRTTVQPATLNEAQLEEGWIQPVMRLLGHHYAVQGQIRFRDGGHRKPDYIFLETEAEKQAITSKVYEIGQMDKWLAVGDAKRWGAKLDQSSDKERNPSQQIDEYLRYSERPWGILTDGRYWRLYHRDTSKYNNYYAVDLESMLERGDVNVFRYFYAFFRLEAFTSGWLAKVLQGSEDFAQKLTDRLEDQVYDALEMIAQGFLEHRRNRLTADRETLDNIYKHSLVLLYRLLFIFYAESREILPLDNAAYRIQMSMDSIKKEVASPLDRSVNLISGTSHIHTRLSDLFLAIDEGNPKIDLPPYNGRLFSDTEHPFLHDKIVANEYLIPALDKLARVNDGDKRVYVDYRDLEVRHLGSIYEKLLEYNLHIADQPLTLKGGQYAPAAASDTILKQAGKVYLRTGSNERKVTGSYYTPDYIVRFIVEKTLEPLLTAITIRHADLSEDASWKVREGEATALIAEVLALNILDPATGSGHFVVDATAYIAEWLRGLGIRPADLGDEDELVYWKRQVASACIYAVDINPLAVELAKLSMWLTTLAKGKPLSFLDHHIRVGNSLVGTNLSAIDDTAVSIKEEEKRRKALALKRQKEATTGQIVMFSDADFSAGVSFAVQQMSAIENTIADHVADVKNQEHLYADLTQRLSAWKQAADVWTARYFGLEMTAAQWKNVRDFTTTGLIPDTVQTLVDKAQALAAQQHFFHWELAFPEIFYDANGQPKANPGFDAVVGNPPYVRQERLQPIKPFLQSHYEVYSGTADLFLYFYERGIGFLKQERRLGYITSGTYMNSNSAKSFRQYIHDHSGMEWVANFGENQPFRGAEMVYPTIAVMRSGKPRETFRNLFIEGNVPFAQLGAAVENGEWVDSLTEATSREEWRFQPKEISQLFQKITRTHPTLGAIGTIFYGIKTGFNEAFIVDERIKQYLVDEHSSSTEIIKPLLRGQDLRPWYQNDKNLFLILAYQGINIEEYPAVKRHLEKYRASLEPKPDNWTGKWNGRASGSYQWYELQTTTTASYRQMSDASKICWPDISKLPRFSRNKESYFNNTVYMIDEDSSALLALLQSRPVWFALSQLAQPLRLRAGLWQYRLFTQFIERLPIPTLTAEQESSLAAIAEEITGLAKSRYQQHEDMRLTIRNQFGGGEITTRVALYKWWEIADEKALNDEIKHQLGQEIPLNKRSEWRGFLGEQTAGHQRLTAQIVALETRLNAIVYDAFDLTPDERVLIEQATKYPYGEV